MRSRKLGLTALVAVLSLAVAASRGVGRHASADKKQNKSIKCAQQAHEGDEQAPGQDGRRPRQADRRRQELRRTGSRRSRPPCRPSSARCTTLGDAATQLKAGLETLAEDDRRLRWSRAASTRWRPRSGRSSARPSTASCSSTSTRRATASRRTTRCRASSSRRVTCLTTPTSATVTGKLFFTIPDSTTAKPIALQGRHALGREGRHRRRQPGRQRPGSMAMTVSVIGAPGTTSAAGGNPGAPTSLPLTSKPNDRPTPADLPVYAIPTKAPRADATPNPVAFPDALVDRPDGSGDAPDADRGAGQVHGHQHVRRPRRRASST